MKPYRSYLAEFLGTFSLVFMGTAVAVMTAKELGNWGPVTWLGIACAFGGTLGVLVLVIGPVSGCHVNPAVSVGLALGGRLPWEKLPGYLIAQFLGGTAASGLLLTLMNGHPSYDLAKHGLGANGIPANMHWATMFGWETLLTAMFLFTILTATRREAPGGGVYAALAIGGFLFLSHIVGAQLGDSSVNPARTFGPALVLKLKALPDAWNVMWVFLVAPIVGAVIGCVVHWLLYDE